MRSNLRLVAVSAVAVAALFPSLSAARAVQAYIGTYTPEPTARGENHGEGIYLVDIDPVTGAPGNRRLVAKIWASPNVSITAMRVQTLNVVGQVRSHGVNSSRYDS